MKQKTLNQVTATIFGVIALLHVLRLVFGWNANIAGWEVPLGVSIAAAIVGGLLSWSAFKLAK